MALDEVKKTKLRALLEALPENMRNSLSRMIEEARRAGVSDPIFELLAEFLTVSSSEELSLIEPEAIEPIAVFREILAPYVIAEQLGRKVPGRIPEAVLRPVWTWLSTDLGVKAIDAYLAASGPLGQRKDGLTMSLARAMQQVVQNARPGSDDRRKYSGQLGGERNFEEFEDIATIFARSKELRRFSAFLTEMDNAAEAQLVAMMGRAIIDLARLSPALPYHAAVLVLAKLGSMSKFAKMAVAGVGSDDIKAISASPFAAFVEIALAETERSSLRVLNGLKQLKSDGTLAAALRDFAMSSRNMRAVLNLDQSTHEWAKRLTEFRTRLSEGITRELNELPRLIRASIKTLRAFDQRRLALPDPVDVDRSCVLIELLNAARLSSTELGVNETVLRVLGDTDVYLDHVTRVLVDDTRNALGDQRAIVRAYAEAAVRMTELLHGPTPAATLRKSLSAAAGPAEPPVRLAK